MHGIAVSKRADAVEGKMKRFVKGEIGQKELPDLPTLAALHVDMVAIAESMVDVNHALTQSELDSARNTVNACNSAWSDYAANGLQTRWSGVQAALQSHNTCRRQLYTVCYPNMQTACNEKDSYKDTVIQAFASNCAQNTCGEQPATDEDKEGCNECLGAAHGLYDAYHTELTGHIDNCNSQTNSCADDDDACDAIQLTYEGDFCRYVDEVLVRMNTLNDCYTQQSAAFDNQVTIALAEETSSKHVFISAFKVSCFATIIAAITDVSGQGQNMSAPNAITQGVRACLETDPRHDEIITPNSNYTLDDLTVNTDGPDPKLEPVEADYYVDRPADQFYTDASYDGIVGYTGDGYALPSTFVCPDDV